jgi:transposase
LKRSSDFICGVQSSEELTRLQKENIILRQQNFALKNIIELLQKDKFGSKSERFELAHDQMLFNELEVETEPVEPEQTEMIEGYERKKKGRGSRKPFPKDLPREEVVIDLPETEKICPHDGSSLKCIGEEVTEKLKTVPAQVSVVVEKKLKYACPECSEHMAQAKANSILPGTIATVELIAFLIFSKFCQGLPLYRLEELFNMYGVELKRGTMASWLIKIAEKLQPIWNVLEEWALASGYMGIDATSVQVLKEEGRKPQAKSFMWARGSPELGIVLFDYNISGAGYVAKELITGFAGALQSDAHRGYDQLMDLLRLGCMMHARRRFYEAYLLAKKMPGLSYDAMSMIKKLYRFEEVYKEQGLTPQQRFERRELEVKPLMEKLKKWCEAHRTKVLSSGPLGNAINYYLDEYEHLTAFLKDGRYEIDNGWIERAIRKFAIGRNNWLFCDSVDGAKASSLFYSLTVTAKLNEKNPFEALVMILNEINSANSIEDYERLAGLLVKRPALH